jgi:cytochrome P450
MAATAPVFEELNEYYASGVEDPYPLLAQRRREMPVMEGDIAVELGAPSPGAMHDGPVYTLLRYDDVRAAFLDAETYSSEIWTELQGPLVGRTMLAMDGDEHRMWRGLLTPVFNPRWLAGWETRTLLPLAHQLIDEFASGRRAELTDFAFRFPVRAIYEVIGFDDQQDSYDDFARLAYEMLFQMAVKPDQPEVTQRNIMRAIAAAQTGLERIMPAVARKRAAGARDNDLICHMINAEFEGRTLTDEEIASTLRSLLMPATESTTRLALNTLTTLLRRPELLDEVRRDRSLLTLAIIEAERYEPVVLELPRVTTRDVEVRGVTIPKGAAVMLCVSSANRDEEAFPEPDEFRLDRTNTSSLTFGFGSHMCVGRTTSRSEIAAMIGALFDRLPGLRLDPDIAPPVIRGVTMRGPDGLHVVWD